MGLAGGQGAHNGPFSTIQAKDANLELPFGELYFRQHR